ncbi:MAG: hypothetical protein EBR10_02270 [Planctomycetes bacterium]|nr:hypothetical protein [Planctomycetota bacterium]
MTRFQPDFMRRDVPLFREQLNFDDQQMEVIESLVNDYDLAFGPAAEASQGKIQEAGMRMFQTYMQGDMRERMRGIRESIETDLEQMEIENGGPLTEEARRTFMRQRMEKVGNEIMEERKATGADVETKAILEEIVAEVNRWTAEKARMRKELVTSIEILLTDAQKANFPKFERFLRREKSLGNEALSGEGTNLFLVIDEAELSQPSIDGAVKILDLYEVELDSALVARDTFVEQSEPKMMRLTLDGNADAARAMAERQIALRKSVRDVNDRFITQIADSMSPDEGAKFKKAALLAAYRRVFRQTRTSEAFEKAMQMTDLSPEQQIAVAALQAEYEGRLTAMNEKIVTTTRKDEPVQRLEESGRMIGVMAGTMPPTMMMGRFMGATSDPVGDLMDERGTMGTKYLEQLRGLLTATQQEQLPKGRDGGRNAGAFGTGKITDLPPQFQEAAKAADKNKDGVIDEDEREAVFRNMRGGRGGGPGGGRGDRNSPQGGPPSSPPSSPSGAN